MPSPAEINNDSGQDERSGRALLVALVGGTCTEREVRESLDVVRADPLTRIDAFRGDLLRALMELPNAFWARHMFLYEQYREVVRSAALARRELPPESRREFWSPLGCGETPNT